MMGVAALALASCSNHDFEYDENAAIEFNKAQIIAKYNQTFIETFGQPAANQDWGFGATRGLTRAVFTDKWTYSHSCDLESKLAFTLPADAEDVTKANFNQNAKNFYVPEGKTVTFTPNVSGGGAIYNYGTISSITGNFNGTCTIYNAGTLKGFNPTTGGRHTIVNTGILEITGFANIGEVYNGGSLTLSGTDVHNAVTIHSNGVGTVQMPNGGDLKAVCYIHGTLKVGDGKNLKIQNSTTKYICGIESTAKVENVDGPLQTSYVKANEFTFDGNPIYLLPGGHVDVTTLKVPNSNCHVYGHSGSVALIEATNVEFGNKNDFTHTFSDNIYFKISGSVKVDNCYAMGASHSFSNVADYLADTTHADEFGLAANRINAGNATGSPDCGQPWSVGTGTTTPPAEEPDGLDGYDFFARVFAEDLSANTGSDFDFNDVVFDVYTKGDDGKIVLLAAGGTLSLTVNGEEVHDAFGVGTGTMVNTFNVNEKKPVVLKKPVKISGMDDVKKIKIEVEKEIGDISAWLELEAETGKPAAKFAVQEQIEWCIERVGIDSKYTNFKSWVETKKPAEWWK